MAIDHPLRQTQAESHTIDAGGSSGIRPEESIEDMRFRRGLDADAGVLNDEARRPVPSCHGDNDAAALRRELNRIVEKVENEPLEPIRVALYRDAVALLTSQLDPL